MKKILPGLYYFTGLRVGRVYMIEDPDGLTIVDAGLPLATKSILKQLDKAGRRPSDVKRLLVTHAHPDHVGGLPKLKQITGAQVIASATERPILEGKVPIEQPPPEKVRGIARLVVGKPTTLEGTHLDREVRDGEVIAEVMGGLQVIATPGHTRGHIAFWQPQKRILICGDVMMNLLGLRLPLAPVTVDMDEARRSIKRVADLQPSLVCFGHGNPLRKGDMSRLHAFVRRVSLE